MIINKVNNKFYIGSTTDLAKRFTTHMTALKKKRHVNKILQSSWNKHGSINFEFIILETCEPNKCFELEQYYIDTLNPEYNIRRFVVKSPMFGRSHTKEAREKISKAASRPHFDTRKSIICIDSNKEVTVFDSVNQAADHLKISRRSISNILNGWSKQTRNKLIFKYSEIK